MQVVYFLGTLSFGWVLALLVNYVSDVLPLTRTFSSPECPQCHKKYLFTQYLTFQKCLDCNKKRAVRTWIVQALIPLALIWLLYYPPGRLSLWMCSITLGYFSVVAVIDFEHRAILYQETVFGAVFGLALGLYLKHPIIQTLLGGLAGFSIMLLLYYMGILFARLIARIRGQVYSDDGLGFGDVTLAGVLGLMLGWPGITIGLILGILLAGAVSAIYLVVLIITRRYKIFSSIPYAPFLVLGSAILLFRS